MEKIKAIMDRFVWLTGGLEFNENKLYTQSGVKIYDGNDKVRVAYLITLVLIL